MYLHGHGKTVTGKIGGNGVGQSNVLGARVRARQQQTLAESQQVLLKKERLRRLKELEERQETLKHYSNYGAFNSQTNLAEEIGQNDLENLIQEQKVLVAQLADDLNDDQVTDNQVLKDLPFVTTNGKVAAAPQVSRGPPIFGGQGPSQKNNNSNASGVHRGGRGGGILSGLDLDEPLVGSFFDTPSGYSKPVAAAPYSRSSPYDQGPPHDRSRAANTDDIYGGPPEPSHNSQGSQRNNLLAHNDGNRLRQPNASSPRKEAWNQPPSQSHGMSGDSDRERRLRERRERLEKKKRDFLRKNGVDVPEPEPASRDPYRGGPMQSSVDSQPGMSRAHPHAGSSSMSPFGRDDQRQSPRSFKRQMEGSNAAKLMSSRDEGYPSASPYGRPDDINDTLYDDDPYGDDAADKGMGRGDVYGMPPQPRGGHGMTDQFGDSLPSSSKMHDPEYEEEEYNRAVPNISSSPYGSGAPLHHQTSPTRGQRQGNSRPPEATGLALGGGGGSDAMTRRRQQEQYALELQAQIANKGTGAARGGGRGPYENPSSPKQLREKEREEEMRFLYQQQQQQQQQGRPPSLYTFQEPTRAGPSSSYPHQPSQDTNLFGSPSNNHRRGAPHGSPTVQNGGGGGLFAGMGKHDDEVKKRRAHQQEYAQQLAEQLKQKEQRGGRNRPHVQHQHQQQHAASQSPWGASSAPGDPHYIGNGAGSGGRSPHNNPPYNQGASAYPGFDAYGQSPSAGGHQGFPSMPHSGPVAAAPSHHHHHHTSLNGPVPPGGASSGGGMFAGLGKTDDTAAAKRRAAAEQYNRELAEQIRLKDQRKKEEKLKQQQIERKEAAQIYDPFGKGGAGAPLKTQDGETVAGFRRMRTQATHQSPTHNSNSQNNQHGSPYEAGPPGSNPYGGYNRPDMNSHDPYGHPPHGAADPYGGPDPYSASDPYGAADPYSGSDPYGGENPGSRYEPTSGPSGYEKSSPSGPPHHSHSSVLPGQGPIGGGGGGGGGGAPPPRGNFMSGVSSLQAGLSDEQRVSKLRQKQQLADDLRRQMEEKKTRKDREKAERERQDRLEYEAAQGGPGAYDPFGKQGAGAPYRDTEGNAVAEYGHGRRSRLEAAPPGGAPEEEMPVGFGGVRRGARMNGQNGPNEAASGTNILADATGYEVCISSFLVLCVFVFIFLFFFFFTFVSRLIYWLYIFCLVTHKEGSCMLCSTSTKCICLSM